MNTVDASGGSGGGGVPGPGGSSVGGGGGVGSGGGPGGGGGSTNGSLNSTMASMGLTQAPTGVAAKISHLKTTLDSNIVNTSVAGGSNIQIGGGAVSGISTIMTSSVSTAGAIKMTTAGGAIATSIGGTPIALNVAQSPTAIRTIGAGGQSTQVRVVMPTNIIPIKQFEGGAGVGRTQITAIPAGVASGTSRTVSNTSITVTRPLTQTTYFPRAGVNATQMTAVGSGQRLVTPIRAGLNTGSMNAGATVTGLTAAGGFVRGAAATVNRNTSSPATSVISPATSTTWMQTNTGGQVQLIRAIPQQTQKRIITAQGMTTNTGAYGVTNIGGGLGTTMSGTIVANTQPTVVQTGGGGQAQNQPATIQAVSSSGISHSQTQSQQQQTYVATLATVLPPRQHQATLVYSSNVGATSQPLTQQPQQFNTAVASGQRLAVATQLTAATAPTIGTASRQIRPIPLPKTFSTAKLNTTSISIRTPNITSTLQQVGGGIAGSSGGSVIASGNVTSTNSSRNTAMSGVTTGVGSNVIPTANLPTTRIIQLQQPGGAAQPIIGSTGRISGNVMFQPIIVNTSGTGKLVSGLRQPVSMSAKPSLTITPFGLGKLPTGTGGTSAQVGVNLPQQQNVTTSIQSSLVGGGSLAGIAGVGSVGNSSSALSVNTANSSGGGVTNLSSAQLVNVSQAASIAASGQLLTAQNIVSSAAGGATTVLPLAITTRGSNILTGTITPLKNANAITVGKVMAAANAANLENSNSATNSAGIITSNAGPPTNVYIHQAVAAQRSHGPSVSVSSTNLHAPPISSSSNTTVHTTTGGSGGNITTSASAFLPQGGTIYYESVPASSVQVSTGVLSLTTTTVTSSTLPQSQNQMAHGIPATNLALSSLPFGASATSHAGNSAATFTVMPSTVGRAIGQLQIPVSSAAGTQIQSVPLRFSAQLSSSPQGANNASSTNTLTADTISVAQATQQLFQQSSVASGQQLLIPVTAAASAAVHQAASGATTATLTGTQGQHVVIPLQTSIKVTGGSAASTVVSNFLRKRDADGSPIRAAKNLAPTLLSMGSGNSGAILTSTTGSSVAPSVGSAFSITSIASSSASTVNLVQTTASTTLTTEALARKDRAQAAASGSASGAQRAAARGESPVSSDGSTTVSANSSPGVDQQMQDGNTILANHMPHVANDSTHFNPINEMYANHLGMTNIHHNVSASGGSGGTPINSRNSSLDHHQQLHAPIATSTARLNGGPLECSTRKRSRRSTNDSQLSSHSQGSLTLPPPTATGVVASHVHSSSNTGNNSNYEMAVVSGNGEMLLTPVHGSVAPGTAGSSITHQYDSNNTNTNAIINSAALNNTSNHKNNNLPPTAGNKENAKPTEYTLRRPRNFTLLNTYKQNWKTANNHFQRYTDVKPREERRPTVIDLANQSNVMGKINGWKIYHLSSQMEDLCENESNGYDQLSNMLKQMETHEKNPEIERINELLKGNIQRSKIIVDGIHEAQNQMMKIFEHKSHISDILHRCASKRNFKKREKF